MEKVNFFGLMEIFILENIKKIKKMDMVLLNLKMANNMKDIGKMENKMEKEV